MNMKFLFWAVALSVSFSSALYAQEVLEGNDDFGLAEEVKENESEAKKVVEDVKAATGTVVDGVKAEVETSEKTDEKTVVESGEIQKAEGQVQKEEKAEAENINSGENDCDKRSSQEDYEKQISAYVKLLNLSVEQRDKAKYINEDTRLKQEQMLRTLDKLHQQALELEQRSLNEFAAILTPEQKELFDKIRAAADEERAIYDYLNSREVETQKAE